MSGQIEKLREISIKEKEGHDRVVENILRSSGQQKCLIFCDAREKTTITSILVEAGKACEKHVKLTPSYLSTLFNLCPQGHLFKSRPLEGVLKKCG